MESLVGLGIADYLYTREHGRVAFWEETLLETQNEKLARVFSRWAL
jgi:hypothetical protein